jgi:hypothetical protein
MGQLMKSYAQIAFEAFWDYCLENHIVVVHKTNPPAWAKEPNYIKEAWQEATTAVLDEIESRREDEEEREEENSA